MKVTGNQLWSRSETTFERGQVLAVNGRFRIVGRVEDEGGVVIDRNVGPAGNRPGRHRNDGEGRQQPSA